MIKVSEGFRDALPVASEQFRSYLLREVHFYLPALFNSDVAARLTFNEISYQFVRPARHVDSIG